MAEDADALGCQAELRHSRGIAVTGTSAERQRAVFSARGDEPGQALAAVVDWIASATAGVG